MRSLIAKSKNKVSVKIVDVDRYGRSVAEVWAGDELLQSVMAGAGMRLLLRKITQNQGFMVFGQIRTLLSLGIIGGGRSIDERCPITTKGDNYCLKVFNLNHYVPGF
ncbi:MAG TPA: thermonuclease family protein [Phormidium sp.]